MSSLPSPFETPAIRMLETRLSLATVGGPELLAPRAAAQVLHELVGDADREHFVALYLNSRHHVTHAHIVSRGTAKDAPVHPREVFKGALLANAAALVVGHNHPSGDVRPSPEDKAITERLQAAGELLGIEVLDSLIVGPTNKFYTAAEDGVQERILANARRGASRGTKHRTRRTWTYVTEPISHITSVGPA